MNSLVYLYDNFLIYTPNVFFLTLFAIGILGLVILKNTVVLLNKSHFKSSKKTGKRKSSFFLSVKNLKFILLIISLFVLIDKKLIYFQLHVEKVMKKIEREIFIED